jgi:hypothetical protein
LIRVIQTLERETADRILGDIYDSRNRRESDWQNIDNRQGKDGDGEMTLWFAEQNDLPNLAALEMHKTACLLWKMAGGADPEDEECYFDYVSPLITVEKRDIFKWISALT